MCHNLIALCTTCHRFIDSVTKNCKRIKKLRFGEFSLSICCDGNTVDGYPIASPLDLWWQTQPFLNFGGVDLRRHKSRILTTLCLWCAESLPENDNVDERCGEEYLVIHDLQNRVIRTVLHRKVALVDDKDIAHYTKSKDDDDDFFYAFFNDIEWAKWTQSKSRRPKVHRKSQDAVMAPEFHFAEYEVYGAKRERITLEQHHQMSREAYTLTHLLRQWGLTEEGFPINRGLSPKMHGTEHDFGSAQFAPRNQMSTRYQRDYPMNPGTADLGSNGYVEPARDGVPEDAVANGGVVDPLIAFDPDLDAMVAAALATAEATIPYQGNEPELQSGPRYPIQDPESRALLDSAWTWGNAMASNSSSNSSSTIDPFLTNEYTTTNDNANADFDFAPQLPKNNLPDTPNDLTFDPSPQLEADANMLFGDAAMLDSSDTDFFSYDDYYS